MVADVPPPRVLTHVLVPDAQVLSWAPAAWRAVRRLVREQRPDVLVTSSPFDSAHLVGLALGRGRPPWVAELRDGWTFEPLRAEFPTAVQRRADRALERRVVRTADAVVAATEPIAADLQTRLGVAARSVPTGWDHDLDAAAAAAVPPALDDGRFAVVHTGTLSGGWGRDPGPLLDALVRARADEPRLQLVLAGRLSPADEAAIAARSPGDGVRRVGLLPRAESLALQRAAGALVLVTSPNPSEATGKLFEYLASGRPIIAIAAGNAAGRTVTATGTGLTVPHGDVEAIAAALVRAARGKLPYAPTGLGAYVQPGPARALLAAAEEAVERAAHK
jgi:glycosyltransferase involved in cell wall biosynthesis